MKVITDFSVSSRPMRIGRSRSEAAAFATGGTESVITQGGLFYRVHTFLASGTLLVSGGELDVEYLVVGSGGGGGSTRGGGGGAGGLLQGWATLAQGSVPVVVGQAVGHETNGENSSLGSIVAVGGGAGQNSNIDGQPGGSGGGAGGLSSDALQRDGGAGIPGQGHNGGGSLGGDFGGVTGYAGGGGGAGGPGEPGSYPDGTEGRNGGPGLIIDIDGTPKTYAAGGRGSNNLLQHSFDQPLGTGRGSWGKGAPARTSGVSGSGIVIVRYQIAEAEYNAGGVQ